MTSSHMALLTDRGVVRVTGPDAGKLLQGLITADFDRFDSQPALFAGLLSPQGKILFDFFVVKAEDGYLIDILRDKAAELAKRLTFYRLRAKVTIADASTDFDVYALWGGAPDLSHAAPAVAYADPRLPDLGYRLIAPQGTTPAVAAAPASPDAYHAHRVGLGIPEGGRDYVLGDTFPHEALFDQIGGVDFDKGCYVGQEVVSRMQHRSSARKRVVPVIGTQPLPPGEAVKIGEAAIGTIGSTDGARALALLRIDRVGEARDKGQDVTVDSHPVQVELPSWVRFEIPSKTNTADA